MRNTHLLRKLRPSNSLVPEGRTRACYLALEDGPVNPWSSSLVLSSIRLTPVSL